MQNTHSGLAQLSLAQCNPLVLSLLLVCIRQRSEYLGLRLLRLPDENLPV